MHCGRRKLRILSLVLGLAPLRELVRQLHPSLDSLPTYGPIRLLQVQFKQLSVQEAVLLNQCYATRTVLVDFASFAPDLEQLPGVTLFTPLNSL